MVGFEHYHCLSPMNWRLSADGSPTWRPKMETWNNWQGLFEEAQSRFRILAPTMATIIFKKKLIHHITIYWRFTIRHRYWHYLVTSSIKLQNSTWTTIFLFIQSGQPWSPREVSRKSIKGRYGASTSIKSAPNVY